MSQQNHSRALSRNLSFLPSCFPLCDICLTLPEIISLHLGSLAGRPDNVTDSGLNTSANFE